MLNLRASAVALRIEGSRTEPLRFSHTDGTLDVPLVHVLCLNTGGFRETGFLPAETMLGIVLVLVIAIVSIVCLCFPSVSRTMEDAARSHSLRHGQSQSSGTGTSRTQEPSQTGPGIFSVKHLHCIVLDAIAQISQSAFPMVVFSQF